MNQEGLAWKRRIWGFQPCWTREPDIQIIREIARPYLSSAECRDPVCQVDFFAQGAFNKLYKVSNKTAALLMRVTLPVDPQYKTWSEVSTLSFLRANTDIPVPRVIAFDKYNTNKLGFEWILMEYMPGVTLAYQWHKLPMESKQSLMKQVAYYQMQLFNQKLRGIGSLYMPEDFSTGRSLVDQSTIASNSVGRMVSMPFFWRDNVRCDIHRGPFTTSTAWLDARLSLIRHDKEAVLARILGKEKRSGDRTSEESVGDDEGKTGEDGDGGFDASGPDLDNNNRDAHSDQASSNASYSSGHITEESDDEDAAYDAERVLLLVEKLRNVLDQVFSPPENVLGTESCEDTVLFHSDLSASNILVDDAGKITAVVDWECVSAVPLWRSCQLPKFLDGPHRPQRPDRETYGEASEYDLRDIEEEGKDSRDLEGMCMLYWTHLAEWEQTQLRHVLFDEMSRLEPCWFKEHRNATLKADFDKAVLFCDDDCSAVERWLNLLGKGRIMSITELIRNPWMKLSVEDEDSDSHST